MLCLPMKSISWSGMKASEYKELKGLLNYQYVNEQRKIEKKVN